jgi:hypothetical protein
MNVTRWTLGPVAKPKLDMLALNFLVIEVCWITEHVH